MQDMHLAGANVDQPLGLEAGQDTADGFDGQPQIAADIGACHREAEAVRRIATATEAL